MLDMIEQFIVHKKSNACHIKIVIGSIFPYATLLSCAYFHYTNKKEAAPRPGKFSIKIAF